MYICVYVFIYVYMYLYCNIMLNVFQGHASEGPVPEAGLCHSDLSARLASATLQHFMQHGGAGLGVCCTDVFCLLTEGPQIHQEVLLPFMCIGENIVDMCNIILTRRNSHLSYRQSNC